MNVMLEFGLQVLGMAAFAAGMVLFIIYGIAIVVEIFRGFYEE